MVAPKKYWLKINDQAIVRFAQPLNPGYVFWLKRRFRARIASDGGERVVMTRREPFTDSELEELYCETEHRQQRVSLGPVHQSQNTSSYALVPLYIALY